MRSFVFNYCTTDFTYKHTTQLAVNDPYIEPDVAPLPASAPVPPKKPMVLVPAPAPKFILAYALTATAPRKSEHKTQLKTVSIGNINDLLTMSFFGKCGQEQVINSADCFTAVNIDDMRTESNELAFIQDVHGYSCLTITKGNQ